MSNLPNDARNINGVPEAQPRATKQHDLAGNLLATNLRKHLVAAETGTVAPRTVRLVLWMLLPSNSEPCDVYVEATAYEAYGAPRTEGSEPAHIAIDHVAAGNYGIHVTDDLRLQLEEAVADHLEDEVA